MTESTNIGGPCRVDFAASLISEMKTYLIRVARSACADVELCQEEAEDLITELFLKMTRSRPATWPPLDRPDEWKKLMGTMIRNLARSVARKKRRREARERCYFLGFLDGGLAKKDSFSDREQFYQDVVMVLSEHCLPQTRNVVMLRAEGFSDNQVARRLNISVGTARRHWASAIGILSDYLRRLGWSLP